jgi:hypothetical protein
VNETELLHASPLDDSLMLRCLPRVFAAGEMLDWEAWRTGMARRRHTGEASVGFLYIVPETATPIFFNLLFNIRILKLAHFLLVRDGCGSVTSLR